ncbi:MAG: outer membrane lipoprotein carrier protein LolA [Parvibaculaceae bacterium]|nr:outer membrane lipoprotein carrier protein LolA [Parvibaculaceae bacterium]
MRQGVLLAAALVGLAVIVVALLTAGSSRAHAATAAANPAPLTTQDRQDLQSVSTYLNGLTSLQGKFLQIAPDGTVTDGNFYLQRPGRLRFEYSGDTKMLVVADGTWVIVQEGNQVEQRYPLSSTPLGILLEPDVKLDDEARVLGVSRDAGRLRVVLADKSGEAPGRLALDFSTPHIELMEWTVTDAQGLNTTVALQDVQKGIKADPALFVLRSNQKPAVGAKPQ